MARAGRGDGAAAACPQGTRPRSPGHATKPDKKQQLPESNEGSHRFAPGRGFTPSLPLGGLLMSVKSHREGSSHAGCFKTPAAGGEGERAEPYLPPRSPPKIAPASRQQELLLVEPPKLKRVCAFLFKAWLPRPRGTELLLPQASTFQPESHSAAPAPSIQAAAWLKEVHS